MMTIIDDDVSSGTSTYDTGRQIPADLPAPIGDALATFRDLAAHADPLPIRGRLLETRAGLLRTTLPAGAKVGELCLLRDPSSDETVTAEVVSLQTDSVWLAPLGETRGLSNRTIVTFTGKALQVRVGKALLGRVLDGLGNALDEAGPLRFEGSQPVYAQPEHPLKRDLVSEPLPIGIRAIDGLLTCGQGQRLGIYGAAGIGKSTLIGEIVNNAASEVNVVALIGERGREVREFLARTINDQGRRRSVFVVATSDRPAVERIKAAHVATAIAEWFRDEGCHVLLVMDSLTRIARAYRDVGLAAGEPPTRRGYPPSVFTAFPSLFERSGPGTCGTITAFYTVLVEGELRQDPIADETIGLLDGHIILSPKLAQAGHHPAIDISQSLSRLMAKLVNPDQERAANHIRRLISRYREVELLIRLGEYQAGSDDLADEAIKKQPAIDQFLQQQSGMTNEIEETLAELYQIAR